MDVIRISPRRLTDYYDFTGSYATPIAFRRLSGRMSIQTSFI
jgi:hypothetical protein